MKRIAVFLALVLFGGLNSLQAATASISASPKPVYIPTGQLGTTVLAWSSAGTPNAEVWVSLDDAPEVLLGRAPSGSVSIPWIQAGVDYRFTVYANTEHTIPLASVLVLGVPESSGAIGATPTAVGVPAGGSGTTVIEWAAGTLRTAPQVWLSVDGGPETLFAQGGSGAQAASFLQAGHDYEFKLYASTSHAKLIASVRVWGEAAYKVGVDYHSTGADFSPTAFLTRYHLPGVRSTVQAQLQGMANRGATLFHTRLWMVTSPGGLDFGEAWRHHFPISPQEAANLRNYAQDVAAIRATDGHRVRLDLTLLWAGDANYQMGSPATGLGFGNLSASVFTGRVDQTIASVLGAVADVTRPDGRRVVDTLNMEGEVLIGAKANQEWFLRTHYPGFVQSVRNAGLSPSLYFQAIADEASILDDGFVDPSYPVLNGHVSMYWIYRSLKFLRDEGMALPRRIDFSTYPSRSSSTYPVLVQRIYDDADATLPSLGIAKKYGVAETFYFTSNSEREALGDAFAAQRNVDGRLERLLFWTTPDAEAPGIQFGYPFEIEDYLP